MNELQQTSFDKLKTALESIPLHERFKGYDPFDGLNSPLIKNTILGKSKWIRLAWVQLFKRNLFNLRPYVGIKRTENPQALAVFLSAYCQLYSVDKDEKYLESIDYLASRIIESQQMNWSGACWSYPFAWQARAFYQPDDTPLIIPTNYCFNALLDAYEVTNNERYKEIALSSSRFVLRDLNRTYEAETFAFSYSPVDNSVVYNASLMASQLLARTYFYTKDVQLKESARLSVEFCVQRQKENGAWTYGTKPFHQWIDNFHSGYNLICLMDYVYYCSDKSYAPNISKGLKYYLDTFFEENGFSRYYQHKKFPLDLNNPAQLVITLHKAGMLEEKANLIEKTMKYSIDKLQSKKGWFFYQEHKNYINKIVYLRWSNSWMFYGFSILSSYA